MRKENVKEFSWVLLSPIISITGSLVLVRLLTEHLNPSEYGLLALGMTITQLINQVVMGGLVNGISRYYSVAVEYNDVKNYIKAIRKLVFIAAMVVMSIGVIIVVVLIYLELKEWFWLAIAALLFSIVSGYNSALNGIQSAARQRSVVTLHSALDSFLKIGMMFLAFNYIGVSSASVVIAYMASMLIVCVSQSFFIKKIINKEQESIKINKINNWEEKIWAFGVPFTSWGIFTWLQLSSDRWALQTFGVTSDVGKYTVLYQLGYMPITIATGIVMSFLGPILYQYSGDATDNSRNKKTNRIAWNLSLLSIVLAILGFLITAVINEEIVAIFVAEEYRDCSKYLQWIVLAGGLFSAGQILALKLMSDMKPQLMTKAKIITAIIGCTLNVIGTIAAGMQGVIIAQLIFASVYLIWMMLLAKSKETK